MEMDSRRSVSVSIVVGGLSRSLHSSRSDATAHRKAHINASRLCRKSRIPYFSPTRASVVFYHHRPAPSTTSPLVVIVIVVVGKIAQPRHSFPHAFTLTLLSFSLAIVAELSNLFVNDNAHPHTYTGHVVDMPCHPLLYLSRSHCVSLVLVLQLCC